MSSTSSARRKDRVPGLSLSISRAARQQDRDPEPRGERLLRQHRSLGDEERHGRRDDAASRMARAGTTAAADVSTMIQWLQANIARYARQSRSHVHPGRTRPVTLHSAPPSGVPSAARRAVGVKGVIFMSGQLNVAPLEAGAVSGWRPAGWTGCWRIQSAGRAAAVPADQGAQPSRKRVRCRGAVLENPEDQRQ